jgi:hypothetical protein
MLPTFKGRTGTVAGKKGKKQATLLIDTEDVEWVTGWIDVAIDNFICELHMAGYLTNNALASAYIDADPSQDSYEWHPDIIKLRAQATEILVARVLDMLGIVEVHGPKRKRSFT